MDEKPNRSALAVVATRKFGKPFCQGTLVGTRPQASVSHDRLGKLSHKTLSLCLAFKLSFVLAGFCYLLYAFLSVMS